MDRHCTVQMRPRVPGSVLAASLWLTLGAEDAASAPPDIEAIRAAKRVKAVRIAEPIRLDGVLDEAAWELAAPATDFYQQQPAEFQPATRRTEVRFLYDATTLYVGAMLYDEAPNRLITNDLKRDFSTLRFPERQTQGWGLNLVRTVRRDNETTTWSPVPRQFSYYNVRYNFIHRPLSDIYVVWNETRLPGVTRRALLLKYTHLIAF